MRFGLLLHISIITRCFSVKLSPLENNDKLQNITNLYVAEWQWETWPVKQDLSEQEPGQRKNIALWEDRMKSTWYLFGGQPLSGDPNIFYSDIWKFTVKTRTWEKIFISDEDVVGTSPFERDEIASRRRKKFNKKNTSYFEQVNRSVIICGITEEKNLTKYKLFNEWMSYRRKQLEKEKKVEDLEYLTVYVPMKSKSNKVWQIDVKEKLWTAYVCCCDEDRPPRSSFKEKTGISKRIPEAIDPMEKHYLAFNWKINNAEDEMADEQQHLSINNLKNKKKKINQIKKTSEKSHLKKINIEKRKNSRNERNASETSISAVEEASNPIKGKTVELVNKTNDCHENKKDKFVLNAKNTSNWDLKYSSCPSERKLRSEKLEKTSRPRPPPDSCPKFDEGGPFLTWCDGASKALVSADISSVQITVWIFDMSMSHWSQLRVMANDGVKWPTCSNKDSIRYSGNGEEVYLICSHQNASTPDSTNPTEIPSENNFNTKLVYRINYKNRVLSNLGEIRFNPYFNSPEGEKVWKNDSLSILQVFKGPENDTFLIFAYMEKVDLWILNKDGEDKEWFDFIEKVWRGSALKWFEKYNAAVYNLQFVSESGNSETLLLPNPRILEASENCTRERGRFIIRIFKNENLRNQSFENRTREQNLTYEPLQFDYKSSGAEHPFNQMYSLKVLVFFGISLAIFSIFGFVVFLKKCVNCPPRIQIRNECHKSPLIIRYSVIPDDLLYPVA